MKAERTVITRGLPKTGQETEYAEGDDGTHEAGWWIGTKVANNKERFLSQTIGEDDVIIDRATGLMWPLNGEENGWVNEDGINWSDAIDYANNLDFAGFTDWRLPNIIELFTIMRHEAGKSSFWPPFEDVQYISYYWSSTTRRAVSIYALAVSFGLSRIMTYFKTNTFGVVCVRGGL